MTASTLGFLLGILVFCPLVGYAAQKKGRNPFGWGISAFFFSPLVVYLILLLVGRRAV
ncbi:hypothetical protein [Flammeovirga pectinis]|uniref:hypothetical protein n=1 Tax=Flammeovirga pectinis TaxID=2494373 RepID=UPI0012D79C2C|nr:hypothetical protein [Flammeovirga pectinis]